MTTTMSPERRELVLTEYRRDLVNGTLFARHATSSRGRHGYHPPIRRDQWAKAATTLAEMATKSDALAQLASRAIHRLNLYHGAPQFVAGIYDALAEAVHEGYTDVIRKSGPEPGRPSEWHRPYTLGELLTAAAWMSTAFTAETLGTLPGLGWVAAALIHDEGVPTHMLPREVAEVAYGKPAAPYIYPEE